MESPKDRPGKPDVAKQTMSDSECLDIAIPSSSKAAQAFLAMGGIKCSGESGKLEPLERCGR